MKILRPLSLAFAGISAIRNQLYDRRILESVSIARPVISVGNLSVGGTGKTPFVSHLLEWSLEQGLKPGVVSRGYKGRFRGEQRVPSDGDGDFFGDEPAQLARRFPQVPVYVGPRRVATAEKLVRENIVDFVIADDAFQHRALIRDLDIVILDALEDPEAYWPLPEGRLREPLSRLARANVIVLSRVNLAPPANVAWLKERLIDLGVWEPRQVFEANYGVRAVRNWAKDRVQEDWKDHACVWVSGVGRPKSFERVLLEAGARPRTHLAYQDHYTYTLEDVRRIQEEMSKNAADWILTTEKDAVKLQNFPQLRKHLWVAELAVSFSAPAQGLYEKILALARR